VSEQKAARTSAARMEDLLHVRAEGGQNQGSENGGRGPWTHEGKTHEGKLLKKNEGVDEECRIYSGRAPVRLRDRGKIPVVAHEKKSRTSRAERKKTNPSNHERRPMRNCSCCTGESLLLISSS
jgi:hypothetical protein